MVQLNRFGSGSSSVAPECLFHRLPRTCETGSCLQCLGRPSCMLTAQNEENDACDTKRKISKLSPRTIPSIQVRRMGGRKEASVTVVARVTSHHGIVESIRGVITFLQPEVHNIDLPRETCRDHQGWEQSSPGNRTCV